MMRIMLSRMYMWLSRYVRGIFDTEPVHLIVIRRYADANGHYVGELYMYGSFSGIGSYRMIGCSLDSFPLELSSISFGDEPGSLDLKHDFLAPMPVNTLRVGAQEPVDNDAVRRRIGYIPRNNIRVAIQNRFIEHILDKIG